MSLEMNVICDTCSLRVTVARGRLPQMEELIYNGLKGLATEGWLLSADVEMCNDCWHKAMGATTKLTVDELARLRAEVERIVKEQASRAEPAVTKGETDEK